MTGFNQRFLAFQEWIVRRHPGITCLLIAVFSLGGSWSAGWVDGRGIASFSHLSLVLWWGVPVLYILIYIRVREKVSGFILFAGVLFFLLGFSGLRRLSRLGWEQGFSVCLRKSGKLTDVQKWANQILRTHAQEIERIQQSEEVPWTLEPEDFPALLNHLYSGHPPMGVEVPLDLQPRRVDIWWYGAFRYGILAGPDEAPADRRTRRIAPGLFLYRNMP